MSFRTPANWERKTKKRKKPKSKFERQTDRLDHWFSLYKRFKDADALGFCTCITCGKKYQWKGGDMHAGHFIGKAKNTMRVRWDEMNCHPQCVRCNSYLEGAKYEYGKALEEMYGAEAIQKMKLKATEHFNPDFYDMEKHIKYYREEFNLMIKQAGVKL